jgi:hypothetical protein
MVWIAIIIGIILLFIFPKQVGILIGLAVAGIGVTYLYLQAEENDRKKQKEAVKITVAYDLKACSEEYPIHITVRNDSKKKVNEVSWNISAHKPGYSNNVVDYGYSGEYSTPYSSDKIINPGQGYGLCYKAPTIKGSDKPEALNWSAVSKSIYFERS